MKRHHIAALVSVLFAGLYLLQSYRDGLNGLPIWGMGFIIVGVVAFFYERWKSWVMSRVGVFTETHFIMVTFIILGAMLVRSLVIGDTIGTVGRIGALVAGGTYMALRSIKKVRPWLRLIPFITVAALLIIEMRSVLDGQQRSDTKAMSPSPAVSTPPATVDTDPQALSSLRQKATNILTSDEVRGEIRAAADAGTPHEALESLSSFKDFMVSKGMTEFSVLDEAPSYFQKIFQKHHPGKVPSDLDAEMQVRLLEMIQEFGVDAGRDKFVRTPEVAIWVAARFNLFQHGGGTVSQWLDNATDAPRSVGVSEPTVLQDSIPNVPLSDGSSPAVKVVSPDYTQQTDVTESELNQDPPATPFDKSPKQIENEGNEGRSPDSFDKVRQLIDQYGTEEGLRRLREIDPEAAKQFERAQRTTPDRSDLDNDAFGGGPGSSGK